jgi:hypothetical protein
MITNLELWKQSIAQLEEAISAMDQAHATLRDIGLDDEIGKGRIGFNSRHLAAKQLNAQQQLTVGTVVRTSPTCGVYAKQLNAGQLVVAAMALLEAIKESDCPECDHLISRHEDEYGCDFERGDVEMPCRDGGTIMAAAGPCTCDWGKRQVNA